MDSEYLQSVRYKLQKRLKRLNGTGYQAFHLALMQVWGFLQGHEITKAILDDLERRAPNCEQEADKTLSGHPQVGSTESQNDAICYWVIKKCASASDRSTEIQIGRRLTRESQHNDCIEIFRTVYVEPLFDYIDEHIDDKRTVLLLLNKFKHRCEWFRREEMFGRFKDDTGQGEKVLARQLYEYLHDQGLQFHVEPESACGRIDLISAQSGKDRLVADAKLFNPERGQGGSYLIKGFRQVYDYTKNYDEPFGYLVVFKTCEQDLSVPTEHQESCVPFITHNNKTIFILVIDIYDYPQSASKRGKIQSCQITPAEFVASLDTAKETNPD